MPPLILTSRTPWRRRPSGLVVPDRSSPLVSGATLYDHQFSASAMARSGSTTFPYLSAGVHGLGMNNQGDGGSETYWSDTTATHGNTITLAMWVTFVQNPGVPYLIFSKRAAWNSTDGFGLWVGYDGNDWNFSINGTRAGWAVGSAVINTTYHVVGTYDQQNVRLYVDGVNVATTASTAAIGTNANTLRLGAISNSRVIVYAAQTWSRALTAGEVWQLYDPATRWSLYAPLVRRTYIALSGSGNTSAPIKGTATLTGYAPTVVLNHAIIPGKGTLAATGYAPTVSVTSGLTSLPGKGTVTVTGYAPTVTQNLAVTPGKGTLTATGYAPSVTVSAAGAITPGTGALVATGYAPTVTVQQRITLGVGVVTATGYAPTVVVALPLTYNVLKASFTVTTPAVDFTLTTPSVTFTAEGA